MLDNVDNLLTKDMIIEMNKILKRNTSDEENHRYNVGGFKVVPNIIGVVNVINTTAPENVEQKIEESIDYTLWYCGHYLKSTKNDKK